MKNKRILKPSIAIAAALIATLSLSVVAFGGPVWRYLQTRVVEGEQYISELIMMESDDGFIMGSVVPGEAEGRGRVVVEIEGEQVVWQDPLVLYDINEAVAHFRGEEVPMLPAYLPEGFVFAEAEFPVCPINNPDVEWAGGQLFLRFTSADEAITLEIRNHSEEWGFDIWATGLEEATINGRDALIGGGGLSVQVTSNTRYTFLIQGETSSVLYDDLVKMAESLQ